MTAYKKDDAPVIELTRKVKPREMKEAEPIALTRQVRQEPAATNRLEVSARTDAKLNEPEGEEEQRSSNSTHSLPTSKEAQSTTSSESSEPPDPAVSGQTSLSQELPSTTSTSLESALETDDVSEVFFSQPPPKQETHESDDLLLADLHRRYAPKTVVRRGRLRVLVGLLVSGGAVFTLFALIKAFSDGGTQTEELALQAPPAEEKTTPTATPKKPASPKAQKK